MRITAARKPSTCCDQHVATQRPQTCAAAAHSLQQAAQPYRLLSRRLKCVMSAFLFCLLRRTWTKVEGIHA